MKGSSDYQLFRKDDILKKEIKVCKQSFYDNDDDDINKKHNDFAILQNYVMHNPLDFSIWQQFSQLKYQLVEALY